MSIKGGDLVSRHSKICGSPLETSFTRRQVPLITDTRKLSHMKDLMRYNKSDSNPYPPVLVVSKNHGTLKEAVRKSNDKVDRTFDNRTRTCLLTSWIICHQPKCYRCLHCRSIDFVDTIFSICASIRRTNWDDEIRGKFVFLICFPVFLLSDKILFQMN